jgi:hypothetical protein
MRRNASTLAACAYGLFSVAVKTMQLRCNTGDEFCLRLLRVVEGYIAQHGTQRS